MWDEVVKFLLNQGLLGLAVLCLGGVVVLFYNELKKERKERLQDIKDMTTNFTEIASETVKAISENTNQLKELRSENRNHIQENDKSIEKLLFTVDQILREK